MAGGEDVLTRSAPSEAGVDARGLVAFLDALEADPGIRPHGLVVLRGGAVIAEGAWAPFTLDRVQLLYSLSKSFTTTAVGLAWQEGLVDLDATVLSYFPELDDDITDPRSRAMTLRHLAAMASGHASETLDLALQRDPENLVRGFLLTPPDADPGTLFAYNQPCTYTLAAIVQRVTGENLLDWLRPRLLDPLGMGEAVWIEAPPGQVIGFSGLHATTRAVARLGELYRRRGEWGGRRILSEEWVDAATRRQIATPPSGSVDWEQGYGYQFWMGTHGYRGDGAWGQFCVVLPEQELVVALTSETPVMQSVLDAVWTHVLPAVGRSGDAAGDAELAARLAGLGVPAPEVAGAVVEAASFAAAGGATGVTAVRVEPGPGDAWSLTLEDAAGAFVVPARAGAWEVAEDEGVPIAASGGATPDGGIVAELLFLESPHTLRITVGADGREARVAWLTEPLHEGSPRAQRAPR